MLEHVPSPRWLRRRHSKRSDIYRYFHAEEQRHANAELALMRRWGMLEEGENRSRTRISGWSSNGWTVMPVPFP